MKRKPADAAQEDGTQQDSKGHVYEAGRCDQGEDRDREGAEMLVDCYACLEEDEDEGKGRHSQGDSVEESHPAFRARGLCCTVD